MYTSSRRRHPTRIAPLALVLAALAPVSAADAQPTPQGDEFAVGVHDAGSQQVVQRTRAVSRAADGSFVVVWKKGIFSGFSGVFAQRYDSSGNALGTEFRVSGEELVGRGLNSGYPAVAHTNDGEFVVVWHGNPSADPYAAYPKVVGQRLAASGDKVGTEFVVGVATPDGLYAAPDVAAMNDGSFVVVWPGRYFQGSYYSQVVGQRLASDASKVGTEFLINSFTDGRAYDPQIGTRGEGSFVVVWTATGTELSASPDGAYAGVFGQRFASNGSRAGTEFQVNTFTTYSEDQPDIAVHSDGSFVVVWRTQYGDDDYGPGGSFDDSITMRRYDAAGNPIDDEEHINTYKPGDQIQPSIAMDDDGGFVVVWESRSNYFISDDRDDGAGLFGRCFAAGGAGAAGEFHVNSYTPDIERNVSIATDGQGAFVMAWERSSYAYSAGGGDAYARRFSVTSCPTSGGTTTTTVPGGDATVTIDKTDNGHGWNGDATIPYVITVSAEGGSASEVVLTETVPEMTTFNAAASSNGWQCTPDASAGSMCTYDVGAIGDGQSVMVDFAADVVEDIPEGWEVFNEVAASGSTSGSALRANGLFSMLTGVELTSPEADEFCEANLLACLVHCIWCYTVYTQTGDPNICEAFDFEGLQTLDGEATPDRDARLTTGSITIALYTLRDRVLSTTRGGRRAAALYYEHSPAMVAAVMSDPNLANLAVSAVQAFDQHVRALAGGNGATAVVTQGQIDALNAFVDALRLQASGTLAAAIDRERVRLELADAVGESMDDLLARLDYLTCEGYEDVLFCGEVTGDCRITATDALGVLNMAVGNRTVRPESDLDGNGGTTATDALVTLNIAVGLLADTDACNVQ